ncbi:MAG: hypothetical protein R3B70_26875 [Polyangiaceae bacterium]
MTRWMAYAELHFSTAPTSRSPGPWKSPAPTRPPPLPDAWLVEDRKITLHAEGDGARADLVALKQLLTSLLRDAVRGEAVIEMPPHERWSQRADHAPAPPDPASPAVLTADSVDPDPDPDAEPALDPDPSLDPEPDSDHQDRTTVPAPSAAPPPRRRPRARPLRPPPLTARRLPLWQSQVLPMAKSSPSPLPLLTPCSSSLLDPRGDGGLAARDVL